MVSQAAGGCGKVMVMALDEKGQRLQNAELEVWHFYLTPFMMGNHNCLLRACKNFIGRVRMRLCCSLTSA